MRKALTLAGSLYFVGVAACFCLAMPVGAQDPNNLFGGDKAAPAKSMSKTGASAKKASAKPSSGAPSGTSMGSLSGPKNDVHAAPKNDVHAAPKSHTTSSSGPRTGPSSAPRGGQGHISGPAPVSSATVSGYCNRLWGKVQNNWDLPNGKNHVILGVDVD